MDSIEKWECSERSFVFTSIDQAFSGMQNYGAEFVQRNMFEMGL